MRTACRVRTSSSAPGLPNPLERPIDLAGERPTFIDLTYALEDVPEARLRAPMVDATAIASRVHVLAHPAATAIALVLSNMPEPVRHSVIQIFEPASERGQAGHPRTAAADDESAFLPANGEEESSMRSLGSTCWRVMAKMRRSSLQTVEQRIETPLASLLAVVQEAYRCHRCV